MLRGVLLTEERRDGLGREVGRDGALRGVDLGAWRVADGRELRPALDRPRCASRDVASSRPRMRNRLVFRLSIETSLSDRSQL